MNTARAMSGYPREQLEVAEIPFEKYHALGNDYLVLSQRSCPALTSQEIVRICDRHFGIGSDGILLDTQESSDQPFSLKIYNPDGGEAEKSGNGLRIFSRYLWDQKRVQSSSFSVHTLGGVVQAQVFDQGKIVEVEMGRVSFSSEAIPMTGKSREVLDETLVLENGEQVCISAATIGNPHCIIQTEQPNAELAKRLGPLVEHHASFPARTNVQFVQVCSRKEIRMEIWERGAGYTLASGSSASATAAVLRRLSLVDAELEVVMPGGTLLIRVDQDFSVNMRGSVTRVASGYLHRELLSFE